MKVSEWLRDHPGGPLTVAEDWTIENVVDRLLADGGARDLWVTDAEGRVKGWLSYRRLAELLLCEHRGQRTRRAIVERVSEGRAGSLMETHFPVAREDEELDDVLHRQLAHAIDDLPVVDGEGRLVGRVSLTEVLREVRRRGTSELID